MVRLFARDGSLRCSFLGEPGGDDGAEGEDDEGDETGEADRVGPGGVRDVKQSDSGNQGADCRAWEQTQAQGRAASEARSRVG
jgi:hypothetical protein